MGRLRKTGHLLVGFVQDEKKTKKRKKKKEDSRFID
jgi:hypothetical protein